MSDPTPSFPPPTGGPLDTTPTISPEAQEAAAVAALRHVWRLLPGRFPWITALCVVAAVAISGFAAVARERALEIFYATGWEVWSNWKWWGLLSSVFIHGGLVHLLFNCYWIWIFGRLLERELGHARYLGLLVAAAWISSAAELCYAGEQGIGLSGVGYAFFGFLLVSRSKHPDFARVLPNTLVRLFFGWLVLCFVLTFAEAYAVANFAHVGGLVTGCLLGLLAYPNPWRRPARIGAIALFLWSWQPLLWCPWHQTWLLSDAYRALVKHDDERALHTIEKILAKDPAHAWALDNAANISLRRKQYALARDRWRVLAKDSADARILNSLAWLLATCPDASVRDGTEAVALALRACASDDWKNVAYIDTLAAAYAETGDFAAAEKWMLKALQGAGKFEAELQPHLQAFRAGKPWRSPE
jgi:membrane associated rhomboid family serine protease